LQFRRVDFVPQPDDPPSPLMSRPPSSTPRSQTTTPSRFRRRVQRGFTLVETMIATMVFTMGILGVYAMMIKSYQLVTLARHRDNARAFLVSFSDQFLRLQTTDMISGSPVLRPLFDTGGSGGDGLTWTDPAGNVYGGGVHPANLQVPLGDAQSSRVMATITRQVTYLDTTGTPAGGNVVTAAGWILQGTFTITYQPQGQPIQSQSIIVARTVP